MKIDLSCPVELWHFKLPSSADPAVYLHLFNLGHKAVNSVQAAFLCFNEKGEKLSRQVERVQGLSGDGRSAFEMRALVEDGPIASSMDFIIEKVWYTDGTVWRRNVNDMAEYTPANLPKGRQLDELRSLAGEDALGYPSDQGNVWVCVCGRPNPSGSASCARCERDKHDVFTLYNAAAIEKIIIEKDNALEEAERKQREEAERLKKEQEDKEKKQRKLRKRMTVGIASLALLSAAAYGVYFHGIPAYRYYQADRRLSLGEFEAAKTAFLDLKEYRDSPQRVLESDYESARHAMQIGTLTSLKTAQDLFDTLGDFKDSAALSKKARYERAETLRSNGDYEAAIALYEEIPGFEQADSRVKLTHYQWANSLMESLRYEEAREKYLALGDYEDSAALAEQSLFLPAMTAFEDKDYEKALSLFSQLPGNSEAVKKVTESHYLWGEALFDAGSYDLAAEQFLLAGDYRDAWRRATESLYRPAVELMGAGEYAKAKEMLDKIPTFEDAALLSEECSYHLGLAQMQESNFEEAITLLSEAPNMALARQVIKEAYYQAGLQKQQAGDISEAAKYFNLAGDYLDADVLAREVSYQVGSKALSEGSYDEAVNIFLGLGDFQDSPQQLQKALYARADKALLDGEYQSAIQQFTALNEFGNSAEKIKQAQYHLAEQALQQGDYPAAAQQFQALGDYSDAQIQYQESVYLQASKLMAENRLADASPLLMEIQGYKDASDMFRSVTYEAAVASRDSGDVSRAAALFQSLGDYQDAAQQAAQSYDTYYREAYDGAKAAIDEKDYKTAAELLLPLDKQNPPEAYSDVQRLYEDAVYRYADGLYADGKPYEALPWYRLIADYRDVSSRKLTRYAYRVIGKWESTKGVQMEFREDGTCLIDGKEGYFVAGQYRLSTGDSPDTLVYTHNITRMTNSSMTLREESTKRLFKMTRLD